ncbi:MAG: hypothetical protein F6K36_20435 [Symploca sp. SIO3C6]|uniref:Uncharacterized protein n=1 Tax=Symploca sp. SIO1C4 TaxID=2607765 RepID=A0A6B3N7E8_9CYAN|nr:hypothetical protein [Symploca sp. SIO3C6]NER26745.1 hypothetical protein [Symploca sp. SIO1C4]NET08228.1 hypothetical protein [Symploca sp. SIO2B6]NET50175.1 hypothetical protein [Merismopedia sp. SIO2A8]
METPKTLRLTTSTCRFCHYYQPEGRRGGFCGQLDVPVQSNWKSCPLAISPFASAWESLEMIWRDGQPMSTLSQEIVCGGCSPEESVAKLSKDDSHSNHSKVEPETLLV